MPTNSTNKTKLPPKEVSSFFLKMNENASLLLKDSDYNKNTFISKMLPKKDLIKIYNLLEKSRNLEELGDVTKFSEKERLTGDSYQLKLVLEKIKNLNVHDAISIKKEDFPNIMSNSLVLYLNEQGDIDVMVELSHKGTKYAAKITDPKNIMLYKDLSVLKSYQVLDTSIERRIKWTNTEDGFKASRNIQKSLGIDAPGAITSDGYDVYNGREKFKKISHFLEIGDRGDFDGLIKSNTLSMQDKEKITQDLLGNLQILKEKGVAHGYINTDRISVFFDKNNNPTAKIGGFEFAEKQTETLSEVFSEGLNNDLFAVGAVLFSLYFNRPIPEIKVKKNEKIVDYIDEKKLNKILNSNKSVPDHIKKLIAFIITQDDNKENYTIEQAKAIFENKSESKRKEGKGFFGCFSRFELFKSTHKGNTSPVEPNTNAPPKKNLGQKNTGSTSSRA